MRQRLWHVLGAVALAAGIATFVPVPGALAGVAAMSGTRLFAVLTSAAIAGVIVILPFVLRIGGRRPVWLALAGAALILGAIAFAGAAAAQRACSARYDGHLVIVGTEWTALGETYARANPGLSRDELLFDSAGVPARLWTEASIGRCRLLVGGTYALWVPFLAICLFATLHAASTGLLSGPARSPGAGGAAGGASTGEAGWPTSAAPIRYDVFVSYRHGGRDTEFASDLVAALEGKGYTVAIDERDFPANASFLHEMERCIRESRFTVALISSRYLGSGNCEEEATICKVLDMGDRRRRLVPMLIEAVPLPAWLFGIVGIDCTKSDPLIDPFEKLVATLGTPLRRLAEDLTA
jgi:hypothetical protein